MSPAAPAATLAARLEAAGLDYEAADGRRHLRWSRSRAAADVDRVRAWAARAGRARRGDRRRPTTCGADPWGPPPPGLPPDAAPARRVRPGRDPQPGGCCCGRDRRTGTRRAPRRPRRTSSSAWRAGSACRTAPPSASPAARRPRRAGASPRCGRWRRARAEVDASFTHDDGRVPRLPGLRGGLPQRRALRPHDRGAPAPRPSPPRPRPRAGSSALGPGRRAAAPAAGDGRRAGRWPRRGRCGSTGSRPRPSGPRRRRRAWRELRDADPGRRWAPGPSAKVLVGLRHGRGLPPRPAGDDAGRGRRRATGRCAPPAGGCCGALAMHYGQPEAAQRDGPRAHRRARGRRPGGGQRLGLQRPREDLRRAAGRRPGVGASARSGWPSARAT